MAASRPLVSVGERGADFLARRGGHPTRFYAYAGGAPTVLVFSGAGGEPAGRELRDQLGSTVGEGAAIHLIATGSHVVDAATFRDPDGLVHASYGAAADGVPTIVVLDQGVRVAAAWPHDDLGRTVDAVRAAVADVQFADDGEVIDRQAPVMFVPNVLDDELCAELIALWESSATQQTGVETTVDGARGEAADRARKRRRDHVVTDQQWLRRLSTHVGRRVMPEIRKAFAYEAKRFEGFKIGCYEAQDAGFFTAHRDNLSPATAHRRFGLTVNINTDYEGGELRFPEYGRQRYRPAAGEALVFSGSHLHEVLPVTRGRRFVLLSFVFGDETPAAT